jgi:hypothetical protein
MSDESRQPDEAMRDPAIRRVVAFARAPVPVSADLDDRIMAGVHAAGPRRGTPVLEFPPVRPAAGPALRPSRRRLALAAAIGALMLGSAWVGRMTAPDRAAVAAAAAESVTDESAVRFVIRAPGAATVALVGDFNAWRVGATPLTATEEEGIWTVTVPLAAGRHEYAFVVDGVRWLPDPNAPRAASADFGTPNSVVTVTGRT